MAFFETSFVLILIVIILAILTTGSVIIQPHQRAFMFRSGVFAGTLNPGFRWVVPVITRIEMLDMHATGLVTTKVDSLLPGGRVKIGNTEWNARSSRKRIPAGKTVKVSGIDEDHIIVEEVN